MERKHNVDEFQSLFCLDDSDGVCVRTSSPISQPSHKRLMRMNSLDVLVHHDLHRESVYGASTRERSKVPQTNPFSLYLQP